METPDNLMRFRMSVDVTRKSVVEEKDAMLHAVRNHTFKKNKSSLVIPKIDKRFLWLLIASCVTTVLVAFIWKLPDAMRAASTMPTKLGEYVYVDDMNIVHVSRRCPRLNYKGMESDRVKVSELHKETAVSYCPKCVSDKDYETLTCK